MRRQRVARRHLRQRGSQGQLLRTIVGRLVSPAYSIRTGRLVHSIPLAFKWSTMTGPTETCLISWRGCKPIGPDSLGRRHASGPPGPNGASRVKLLRLDRRRRVRNSRIRGRGSVAGHADAKSGKRRWWAADDKRGGVRHLGKRRFL